MGECGSIVYRLPYYGFLSLSSAFPQALGPAACSHSALALTVHGAALALTVHGAGPGDVCSTLFVTHVLGIQLGPGASH